jgi:hypothetical protein
MTNWEASQSKINFRDCLGVEIPKDDYELLKKECWKAKERGEKYNNTLVGHMKEEYEMEDITESFNKFLLSDCLASPQMQKNMKEYNFLNEDRPIYISDMWVNFQKKYEFNPPHDHSGLFSFVVFINIPYDLKEEEKYFGEIRKKEGDRTQNHTSKFAFLNTDYSGRISCDPLDVDKSFEGKMLLFSAKQIHQVFPFFTSDDYRITVSGNMKLLV